MDKELLKNFKKVFKSEPTYFAISSGRFEVIGNHTDHNGGLCVAASCDLAISGYLKETNDDRIHLYSEGYQDVILSINDLSLKEDEIGTSTGLVKGVAYYLKEHGYKIGGFDIVTKSTVFRGAGVSSSAAFESLIGQIFNVLFNEGKISKIELAKAGQYAENNYFMKKSGLLDQSAVCFGNISFMDFSNMNEPKIKTIDFPFSDMQFVIVNTGGSHAALNDLYSAIPNDMKNAAKKVGKNLLSETTFEEIEKNKDKLSEMEYKRAKHFFSENKRVLSLVNALEKKDKIAFLNAIKGSFISSRDDLKNMMVKNEYVGSPLQACDYAYEFLNDIGACRINGGGFAGSIIACLPKSRADAFIKHMAIKYGLENISKVDINPYPPIVKKL